MKPPDHIVVSRHMTRHNQQPSPQAPLPQFSHPMQDGISGQRALTGVALPHADGALPSIFLPGRPPDKPLKPNSFVCIVHIAETDPCKLDNLMKAFGAFVWRGGRGSTG